MAGAGGGGHRSGLIRSDNCNLRRADLLLLQVSAGGGACERPNATGSRVGAPCVPAWGQPGVRTRLASPRGTQVNDVRIPRGELLDLNSISPRGTPPTRGAISPRKTSRPEASFPRGSHPAARPHFPAGKCPDRGALSLGDVHGRPRDFPAGKSSPPVPANAPCPAPRRAGLAPGGAGWHLWPRAAGRTPGVGNRRPTCWAMPTSSA